MSRRTRRQGKEIDVLIKKLGDDDPQVREDATQQLMKIEEAGPALRKAATSSDLEVVTRARRILEIFKERELQRALQRIKASAKAMEPDLLAERIVRWQGANDEAGCWQAMIDLRRNVARWDRELKYTVPPEVAHFKDFAEYVEASAPKILPPGRPSLEVPMPARGADMGLFVARGERVTFEMRPVGSLIVSSGPARFPGLRGAASCIIIAGDNMEMTWCTSNVLFCDGDVVVREDLARSVVVARGAIRCPKRVWGCVQGKRI